MRSKLLVFFCERSCSGLGYYEQRVSTDGGRVGCCLAAPWLWLLGSGQAVPIQTLSPELGQRPCALSQLAEVFWGLLKATLFGNFLTLFA